VLAWPEFVATRKQGREGGGTTRFHHHPQSVPKGLLSAADRFVGNEDDTLHIALGKRKDEPADAARCERIRRDTASRRIDRASGRKRHGESGGGFGLDSNHPDPSAIPGGDAADKPAAADSDEKRVDIGALLLDLQPDCPLAQQRLALIKGMDRERSRPSGPLFAGCERIVIAIACDHQLGTIIADSLDLRGR
jgi:hypothetical protein